MEEFIVAIELGSTKIIGVAGRKELDGSFSVLATAKEDASTCIRKGIVYNLDKTALCIKNIVGRLETSLKTRVARVYVGVGGQSLRSIKNVVGKDLPANTIVTIDMIDELRDTNRNMPYPDMEILRDAIQEYKVDNQYQVDPVGIPCQHLDGNFLNIVWRKTFYNNLNKCFEMANVKIAEMRISLLALANNILTEAEKRTGCILVDLGAETTSMAVYHKNILRHLAVIPIGSNNITKDIASLNIEEDEAERLKLKYGNGHSNDTAINSSETITVDADRTIKVSEFSAAVEARAEEIVQNVEHQIPFEYNRNLMGGIILTGGGANLKNIDVLFRNITHIDKVRIAKFINQDIHTLDPEIKAQNGLYNTVLGLMVSGDMNCAGNKLTNDLFGPEPQPEEPEEPTQPIITVEVPKAPGYGDNQSVDVVIRPEDLKEEEEEMPRRKGNGMFKRIGNRLGSWLGSLIDEED